MSTTYEINIPLVDEKSRSCGDSGFRKTFLGETCNSSDRYGIVQSEFKNISDKFRKYLDKNKITDIYGNGDALIKEAIKRGVITEMKFTSKNGDATPLSEDKLKTINFNTFYPSFMNQNVNVTKITITAILERFKESPPAAASALALSPPLPSQDPRDIIGDSSAEETEIGGKRRKYRYSRKYKKSSKRSYRRTRRQRK